MKIDDPAFLKFKVNQFWRNVFLSSFIGVLMQTVQLHLYHGRELLHMDDLFDMGVAFVVSTLATVLVSYSLKLEDDNYDKNQ